MSFPHIRSPMGYPNGQPALTPSQPPLGPLPIIRSSERHVLPSPGTPPEAVGEDFTESDQIQKLCDQLKAQSGTIGVWYPTGGNQVFSERIAACLRELLSGGVANVEVLEMKKDGQHWIGTATSLNVNFHVFVGLPPQRRFQRQNSNAQDEDFFMPLANDGHRVSEVVFIDFPATTPSQKLYLPKQLKGFLHLDARMDTDELVNKILGHFGANQPIPYAIDNAYWSKMPKLINVTKERASLGITLVTREMSPDSVFPRIALIKALNEDCLPDLRRRVGRYTHIQSINGCFLDGYSIKNISAIFQRETRQDNIQLMVRFIHSKQVPSQRPLPSGESTCILDPSREDLPMPLFILSDNTHIASLLFDYLTTDQGPRSTLLRPSTHSTAVSCASDVSDPKFDERSGSTSALDANGEVEASPLKKGPKTNKLWLPFDSDQSMRRGSICSNYANSDHAPTAPVTSKTPKITRMLSVKNMANRHYVPQMFTAGFERRFAHIFLRTAGLYLVTGWLKDLADDPLIQFENLSFWLRLVQQRTVGDEKRTIIVGMYNSQEKESLPQILSYVDILSEALHESDLHKQLFDQNQYKRPASGKHNYVFKFDVAHAVDSCYELYSRIEQCMDLFVEKTYRFYPECFDKVFKAFDGLNVALRELASMKKLVASSEDMKTLCEQKPDYALGTLQAYSPSLINPTEQDALLKPHFLVELMTKLGSTFTDEDTAGIYQVYHVTNKSLKPLPVVTTPWPSYVMETISREPSELPLNNSEKQAVVSWAELLGLIFLIGSDGPKRDEYYFVPSLATNMMGEHAKYHWSDEKAEFYRHPDATVLYAYLHFPANHQFFDRLLSVLIKEGFVKRLELFLNRGCMEAILPIFLKDQSYLYALMVYHPLQNIIEFRTRTHGSKRLPFKNAVLHKLDTAFSSSQFHTLLNFVDAITLHVPAKEYPEKLTKGSLWKLIEMENEDEDGDDNAFDILLRTVELKDSMWEPRIDQSREMPPELYLRWAKILGANFDHWSLAGSKLKLLSIEDINFMRNNPSRVGAGAEILSKWKLSNIPVQELVRVLKEIGLIQLGCEIEENLLPGSDV